MMLQRNAAHTKEQSLQLTGVVGKGVGRSDGEDVGGWVGCGRRYRGEEVLSKVKTESLSRYLSPHGRNTHLLRGNIGRQGSLRYLGTVSWLISWCLAVKYLIIDMNEIKSLTRKKAYVLTTLSSHSQTYFRRIISRQICGAIASRLLSWSLGRNASSS